MSTVLEQVELLQRFYDEHKDLWHCTMEDHEAAVEYVGQLHRDLALCEERRRANIAWATSLYKQSLSEAAS